VVELWLVGHCGRLQQWAAAAGHGQKEGCHWAYSRGPWPKGRMPLGIYSRGPGHWAVATAGCSSGGHQPGQEGPTAWCVRPARRARSERACSPSPACHLRGAPGHRGRRSHGCKAPMLCRPQDPLPLLEHGSLLCFGCSQQKGEAIGGRRARRWLPRWMRRWQWRYKGTCLGARLPPRPSLPPSCPLPLAQAPPLMPLPATAALQSRMLRSSSSSRSRLCTSCLQPLSRRGPCCPQRHGSAPARCRPRCLR